MFERSSIKLDSEIKVGEWIFNEIKIDDKNMYANYIKKTQYPINLWALNFDFLWAVSRLRSIKVLWKVVDDMLVTFLYRRKKTLYLMYLPLGAGDADKVVDVLYKCMKYCYEWNDQKSSYTFVRWMNRNQYEFLSGSENFSKYFKLEELDELEPIYSIQKIISLRGKEFENVRYKVNKFNRKYPNAIIRRYQPSDYQALMQLYKAWVSTSGKKYSSIYDGVYYREIAKHYEELSHIILVIELDDKIIGMISGGESPDGQSWCFLCKSMENIGEASYVLLVELAREINRMNPSIELLNYGSDGGIKGLRFFKERFRPVLSPKLCEVYLKRLR